MATQVAREIVPAAKQDRLQLLLVSIGTVETGQKFAAKTGFPEAQLFADSENATYDALGLNQGLGVTYISPLVRLPRHSCHCASWVFGVFLAMSFAMQQCREVFANACSFAVHMCIVAWHACPALLHALLWGQHHGAPQMLHRCS